MSKPASENGNICFNKDFMTVSGFYNNGKLKLRRAEKNV